MSAADQKFASAFWHIRRLYGSQIRCHCAQEEQLLPPEFKLYCKVPKFNESTGSIADLHENHEDSCISCRRSQDFERPCHCQYA